MLLRPHQEQMVSDAREALRTHRRVLIQGATGIGKTFVAAYIVSGATQRGQRSWFITHRREILEQTVEAFRAWCIPAGVVSAGFLKRYHEPVQICSIDSLRTRLDDLQYPNIIIFDECHHCAAGTWAGILQRYDKARIIGLSATPTRLDGKGLKPYFDALVHGPSVSWLIDNKWLAPYKAYSWPQDVSGVPLQGGDFKSDELATKVNTPKVVGDCIAHYGRIARGKRAIIFAVNLAHSRALADAGRAVGLRMEHIHGSLHPDERDEIIQSFRDGTIDCLTNCRLVEEGFDLSGIECVIDCAPTLSLTRAMQRWGRGLRPKPTGQPLIILDHAGNIRRHGLPDDERVWTLDDDRDQGKRRAASKETVSVCPQCYAAHKAGWRVCADCGHIREVQAEAPKVTKGELVEIERLESIERKRERQAQGMAQSLKELQEIARRKGYAPQWAYFVWQAKQRKQQRKRAGNL